MIACDSTLQEGSPCAKARGCAKIFTMKVFASLTVASSSFSKKQRWIAALALGGAALGLRYRTRSRKARGHWSVHVVGIPSTDGYTVRGYLRFPDGKGPFPAVVMLHGGHGGSPMRASVMA